MSLLFNGVKREGFMVNPVINTLRRNAVKIKDRGTKLQAKIGDADKKMINGNNKFNQTKIRLSFVPVIVFYSPDSCSDYKPTSILKESFFARHAILL